MKKTKEFWEKRGKLCDLGGKCCCGGKLLE